MPASVRPAVAGKSRAGCASVRRDRREPNLGGMSGAESSVSCVRVQPLSPTASWMFSWIGAGAAQRPAAWRQRIGGRVAQQCSFALGARVGRRPGCPTSQEGRRDADAARYPDLRRARVGVELEAAVGSFDLHRLAHAQRAGKPQCVVAQRLISKRMAPSGLGALAMVYGCAPSRRSKRTKANCPPGGRASPRPGGIRLPARRRACAPAP